MFAVISLLRHICRSLANLAWQLTIAPMWILIAAILFAPLYWYLRLVRGYDKQDWHYFGRRRPFLRKIQAVRLCLFR